jgi:hypothetical protein
VTPSDATREELAKPRRAPRPPRARARLRGECEGQAGPGDASLDRRLALVRFLAHRSPAGRLEAIEAAVRSGRLERDAAFALLEMPVVDVCPLAVCLGGTA